MAVFESCPKHNMVAYLEKTKGNAEFHEIIDFLARSSIHHALTVSPVVYTTFVEQFWMSAKSKIINIVRYITVKVVGKPVSISEASIRSDLLFDDADGIDSLPNQAIFDAIQLMGYEGDLTVLTFNKALFLPQWRMRVKGGSERPSEPQPTASTPHLSKAHVEHQSDPSPGPSPTIPIPEGSGGNLGSQSSSNKSLSGSEDGLTLQSVYDLYLSLCTQVKTQAAEIKSLKALVKKLKKKARPFILHHKAWVRTVKRKNQNKKKVLKTSKKRIPTNTEWDDLDMDIDDTMDYTLAQDEGKTDKVDEKGESTAQQQSTNRQDEGTDMPKVSTARTKLSTDKLEEGTAKPEPRESTSSAAQTTPTPTPTTIPMPLYFLLQTPI
ncbi:hypothetical protein Tco_1547340 [Tanacetum coccineum]